MPVGGETFDVKLSSDLEDASSSVAPRPVVLLKTSLGSRRPAAADPENPVLTQHEACMSFSEAVIGGNRHKSLAQHNHKKPSRYKYINF